MNDIEKAIKIMKYNKHLLGFPEQGETWKECANTIACDIAISALEKQLNGGWISVSERLPEEFGCYLVAWRPLNLTAEDIIKNTGTVPHYYEILTFYNAFVDGWDDIEQCDEYEILAWQPLPEPYKEVENGVENKKST